MKDELRFILLTVALYLAIGGVLLLGSVILTAALAGGGLP